MFQKQNDTGRVKDNAPCRVRRRDVQVVRREHGERRPQMPEHIPGVQTAAMWYNMRRQNTKEQYMPAVMEAIDKMTASEKFRTMEYIWSSLRSSSTDTDGVAENFAVLSEWMATAKRRRADIIVGATRTIPVSEVIAEARKKAGI